MHGLKWIGLKIWLCRKWSNNGYDDKKDIKDVRTYDQKYFNSHLEFVIEKCDWKMGQTMLSMFSGHKRGFRLFLETLNECTWGCFVWPKY